MDDVEGFLLRAKDQERQYDWLGVADTFGKALKAVPGTEPMRIGSFLESRAYALYRAAFQSDSNEQFRERMWKAVECSGSAKSSFEKAGHGEGASKELRCDADARYYMHWHASSAEEKKALANQAWDLAKKALESFRSRSDGTEYCRTYIQLALAALPVVWYEEDFQKQSGTLKEAITLGEHALDCVPDLSDSSERALVYLRASLFLAWYAESYADTEESLRIDRQARDQWEKAKAISKELAYCETAKHYLAGMPTPSDQNEPLQIFETALAFGRKVNDRLLIGSALEDMAQRSYYRLAEAADSDELEAEAARCFELALNAQREYAVIGYFPMEVAWTWPPCPDPWHYAHLSSFVADLKRKRELAEKALECEPEMIEKTTACGYPEVACDADLIMTIALTSLAKTERDEGEKSRLLRKALERGRAQLERWGQLYPFHYGSRSFSHHNLADAEYEFAMLEKDPKSREQKLRDALLSRTKATGLTEKFFLNPYYHQPRFLVLGGIWVSRQGKCAMDLYALTKDPRDLEEAVRAFEAAIEYYDKADQPSRSAENLWSAARACDVLEDHQRAHERFSQAAEQYGKAAERLPQLVELYRDYAKYMEAWSEMERAKHSHLRQEYALSAGHYGNAAELLASTERWQYLSENYAAWSSVEKAESLSNAENNKEAILAFEEASERFEECRKTIPAGLREAQDVEEGRMATDLIKAAGLRKDYCRARIVIEEARLLGKQAQDAASSKKYAQAVQMLERISSKLDTDQDKKEIGLVVALAKAWQVMASAEAEDSPELFGQASELFERVKDLSESERAKALASGHSRFCKALEAGMRFSDTCEAPFHAEATRYLESAAKHYLKAGLVNDSEYVKASKMLFDAYVHMDGAVKEEDQAKKARLYAMTEKVLEASAAAYSKAGYPKKREQVMRLLDKVKGEREMAVTLAEVLHAPDLVSSTASFAMPTASGERAVGLHKFERAHVEATVVAQPKDLRVGEDARIEIEFVNAGGGPAQLTMVENVIPPGFDVVSKPERCRVEESGIDLRGRKLDALATDIVSVVIRPLAKGTFTFVPRTLYIDESGEHKSAGSKRVTLTVKELGVSGWLKGPEKKRPPA